MDTTQRGCLGKLAVGAVVCVVLALSAGYLSMGSLRRSADTGLLLEHRFGPQESFTPSPDGTVAADRLEIFCSVREQLQGACRDLATAENGMTALEGLDGRDRAPRTELIREALRTVKGGMSLGPVMGGFFETRNRALLAGGMGLGEYTYIYFVAYHDRLVGQQNESRLLDEPPANRRLLLALHSMLSRQLELVREHQGALDLQVALEAEVATMTADPTRLPWLDGLPEAVADSVAPRRAELDELFCDVAAPLELKRNRRYGPGIHTE
jgi:hypothetical protein